MNASGLLDLTRQCAVVTGGVGGLGRATATVLATQGASVVLLDRDAAHSQEVADEIATQNPGTSIIGLGVDLCNADSVKSVFEDDRLSEVNILVNSAGVREIAPAERLSPGEWDKAVDVNLNGTFYSIHHAIEPLKRAGGGSIVNIASVAGLIAMADRPAYSATKHAVIGLTKNLAHDLGRYGIRVNAIAPGTVRTPMTEAYYDNADFLHSMDTMVPLNREGTAEDIALTTLFLVSPLARFVTGTVLPVDGGWLAQKNYMPDRPSSAYSGTNSR